MMGKKSKLAVGLIEIEVVDKKENIMLKIGDVMNYIKSLREIGISQTLYISKLKEDLDEKKEDRYLAKLKSIKTQEDDIKKSFVEKGLIQNGMKKEEATKFINEYELDILTEGNIEVWIGLLDPEAKDEYKELDEKSKNR